MMRWLGILGIMMGALGCDMAIALPPPEDTPEEILRTEIILEARSPIDGEPMTVEDYAELQAVLEAGPDLDPELAPQVREVIQLLRLRQAVRTFFPFLIP